MRYREGWLADAALLRAAALAAPQSPVPTCPGWVGRDVVDHVGEVYAHKTAVLRLGRRPAEGEWPWAPDDDTVFAWFDERLAELLHELDSRDPADPAWTFLAADQSVGFWWRRMAHETAIHRVDAELAAGLPVTAHDPALAADGVAELVGFACDPSLVAAPQGGAGAPGTVLVDIGAGSLLVTLSDDTPQVAPAGAGAHGDAVVRGTASDVYRGLWNRPGDAPLERTGDARVLERFDARLSLARD